jgi:phosphoglycerate kinase
MDKLLINQLPAEHLRGKRVFVRIDVDGEQTSAGFLFDEHKLRLALPTFQYLTSAGARVIIGTHVGDPAAKGLDLLRLDPVGKALSRLMEQPVRKLHDVVGEQVLRAVTEMQNGDVILLENLLFHPGEDTNCPEFAQALARLCDIYCNDAFSLACRPMASTLGITRLVRPAAAGLALGRELMMFEVLLDNPDPPFLGLIAGACLKEKLSILENLLERVNILYVGGALSFTFLRAKGCQVGASPVDNHFLPRVRDFLRNAKGKTEVVFPLDFIVVPAADLRDFENGLQSRFPESREVLAEEMRPSDLAVDIGPRTLDRLKELIGSAHTILWNGPIGIWEYEPFAKGMLGVARSLIEAAPRDLQRIVICGDNLARAIRSSGLSFERIRHLTSGGKAALQLLAGNSLPAVAALDDAAELVAPNWARTRRVLLAVDGSEVALETARRLGILIDAERSEIDLLHVQKPLVALLKGLWIDPEKRHRLEIERRLEAERIFMAVNAALAHQGLISRHQLTAEGDPANEILKCSGELNADLIALGGYGDVSQKVTNRSERPVLVVPGHETFRSEEKFGTASRNAG